MSCVESCSTDSGVENPATVVTLVAPGAGGGGTAGVITAESPVAAAVSVALETGGFLSTGTHAAATTRVVHRTVALIENYPPRPRLRCAARHVHESPRRCGLRAESSSAGETYPRRTACALRAACGRPAAAKAGTHRGSHGSTRLGAAGSRSGTGSIRSGGAPAPRCRTRAHGPAPTPSPA